jgi:hypothetical protein
MNTENNCKPGSSQWSREEYEERREYLCDTVSLVVDAYNRLVRQSNERFGTRFGRLVVSVIPGEKE